MTAKEIVIPLVLLFLPDFCVWVWWRGRPSKEDISPRKHQPHSPGEGLDRAQAIKMNNTGRGQNSSS